MSSSSKKKQSPPNSNLTDKQRFHAEKRRKVDRKVAINKLAGIYKDPKKDEVYYKYPKEGPNTLRTGTNKNMKDQTVFLEMKDRGLTFGGGGGRNRRSRRVKSKNNQSRRVPRYRF